MTCRLSLLLLVAPLAAVHAQRTTTSLDIGATALRYADTVSSAGVALTPMLSFATPRSTFDAVATFSRFGSGSSAQGSLTGSAFSAPVGPLSAELTGGVGGSVHGDGGRTGQGLGSLRGHAMADRLGAWAGAGGGGMWDGDSWRSVRQLDLGVWAALTPSSAMTLTTNPTAVDDTIEYVDTQASVRWILPAVELGFSAGFRSGSRFSSSGDSRTWGGVTVVAPVARRASIVLNAGTYPLDLTQGYPAGRYFGAAVRFTGQRAAVDVAPPLPEAVDNAVARFTMGRPSGSEIVLEVRAPSARTVEVSGDFTQWDPLQLTSLGNGLFSLKLPVISGTYQMNVRVDGGRWLAPPGLTAIKDELGNPVGILIVPDR
jgi:hypothetical protein